MKIYTKEREVFKRKRTIHKWLVGDEMSLTKIGNNFARPKTIIMWMHFEIVKSRSLIITIHYQSRRYAFMNDRIFSNHNGRSKIFYFPSLIKNIDNETTKIMSSCFKRNKFINIEIRRMLVRTIKRLYKKA